ncbi:DNA replication licensing factor MCM6 [Pancytospora philotis]|nr:DNA replication licensing factor MCM6 [Pancytospora philotis]
MQVEQSHASHADMTMPADQTPLADRLLEYLEGSRSVHTQLQQMVDTNAETFVIDLNSVRSFDPEFYASIHENFRAKYEVLAACFREYAVRTVGRPLGLSFTNAANRLRLRELRTEYLQRLVAFSGTATRSSQVRPELREGVFLCQDCGTRIAGIEQEYRYTPPVFCPNSLCTNRSKFDVVLEDSGFCNWQRINVQESTEEIPDGSLPRMIEVIVREGMVEKIKPGSHLLFTGYAVVVPTGPALIGAKASTPVAGMPQEKAQRRTKDLNYKICFMCIHAAEVGSEEDCNGVLASAEVTEKKVLTEEEMLTIERMRSTPSLYEKLGESLFPTIHGHPNIKAAILLMLVGGVAKRREVRLRGDINVLLVGDPGTAKSQFLKQTAAVHPRSVYTSGKSSSAAGLTAAVVKDTETGEFTIEAGALMLSDTGVCCIDEFDKMTYKDQVSIHEAMEQQTITIAKAGINATLNSRTSILAAANPIHGRYDKRKTLRQNVNLSAPIMSRFDLYFVLIDEIDKDHDRRISRKILENHLEYSPSRDEAATLNIKPFTVEEAMLYINYVKNKKPQLSEEATDVLVGKYTTLRQDSLVNTNNYKMTARHLESLIRLSEALAKIHNDPVVGPAYVEEAARLLKSSVIQVSSPDINLVCKEGDDDFVISNKDYLKILNSIVYLVKSLSLSRGQLVEKYLEYIEESIPSTEALEAEKRKCERAVAFLIEKEGVMFEVEGVVYVHPNYDC